MAIFGNDADDDDDGDEPTTATPHSHQQACTGTKYPIRRTPPLTYDFRELLLNSHLAAQDCPRRVVAQELDFLYWSTCHS